MQNISKFLSGLLLLFILALPGIAAPLTTFISPEATMTSNISRAAVLVDSSQLTDSNILNNYNRIRATFDYFGYKYDVLPYSTDFSTLTPYQMIVALSPTTSELVQNYTTSTGKRALILGRPVSTLESAYNLTYNSTINAASGSRTRIITTEDPMMAVKTIVYYSTYDDYVLGSGVTSGATTGDGHKLILTYSGTNGSAVILNSGFDQQLVRNFISVADPAAVFVTGAYPYARDLGIIMRYDDLGDDPASRFTDWYNVSNDCTIASVIHNTQPLDIAMVPYANLIPHSYDHVDLSEISDSDMQYQAQMSMNEGTALFGKTPIGFVAPWNYYTYNTTKILYQTGFHYMLVDSGLATSSNAKDLQYYSSDTDPKNQLWLMGYTQQDEDAGYVQQWWIDDSKESRGYFQVLLHTTGDASTDEATRQRIIGAVYNTTVHDSWIMETADDFFIHLDDAKKVTVSGNTLEVNGNTCAGLVLWQPLEASNIVLDNSTATIVSRNHMAMLPALSNGIHTFDYSNDYPKISVYTNGSLINNGYYNIQNNTMYFSIHDDDEIYNLTNVSLTDLVGTTLYLVKEGANTGSFTPANGSYTLLNLTEGNYIIRDTPLLTPIIIWNTPEDITYGTPLSSTQLNASASVPGNFTYTPAAGTLLSAGIHTLQVDFTPADTANYTNATAEVTIIVKDNPDLPLVNFTSNVTSGSIPFSVQFTSLSINATTWNWDFGDGQTSTDQSPSHTYFSAGTYTVSLNVSNTAGYNISTKPNYIFVTNNGLVVYYDGNLSGNLLVDLSGNSNTGYATSVTQETNLLTDANYINLNGVSSKIDVSNNAQTNISSPVSIEFIGSINAFSKYGSLVSKYRDSTTGWYLSCSSLPPYNKVRFGVNLMDGREINFDSNTALVAGQVYDFVATYDNNTAHIYVNGVDSGSTLWNSPIKGGSNNITFAYGDSINKLNSCNCSMYTFRLYNRSLSSAEVMQNYKNDRWKFNPPTPSDNITMIKKMVYGDGGLPRYMGLYAMQQSGSEISLIDSNISSLGLVSTPYYQDNGSPQTNYTLLNSSMSGVKWKNYYASGSSASLLFSGNNRSRLENINLSNSSFDISSSVTYNAQSPVTLDAVPVTGNAFQFYGDGLNTISGNTVQAYTDNGLIQNDRILTSTGGEIYNYYQNRTVGTTRSNSIGLPLTSPQLTPMSCPGGYLGSLSFAIHADYQDPDSLKTLMYGTNDTKNPVYGTRGYIGHGLNCTWAAFAGSTYGGYGFDNASFKSTLDDMYAHGFEIIPHNVLGDSSNAFPTREITAYYLPWYFNNYSSRNWIDHGLNGGNRNTGLKSQGLDKTSQYYIGDLLHDNNIQYAWAYQDYTLSNPGDSLSTSQIQSLGLPYDVVWTNTNFTWDDGTPMYEWTSTWADDSTALSYFNNDTIQAMINNYGVCFWHDYTAQNNEPFENYYYTKGNPNMINQTYDNLLQNISDQKVAGKLWNPTVSQYIDYWRTACNVECKCTGQNTYTLINHNSAAIPSYAMRVSGSYTMKLDGNSLSTRTNGGDTVFWMDLSPGTHLLTFVEA